MPTNDPDLPLVEAAQTGDDSSFDALLERHQEKIFHFILRHISIESDAVDLTQETFVRAYFNIKKFKPGGLFTTWLYQIALNLCRDFVRSKSWRNRQQTDSLSPSPSPSGHESSKELKDPGFNPATEASRKEEMEILTRAINRLPLELKGPLLLTAVEGLSHLEAGERLGLTAKAVEVKVYRARKALLEQLGTKPII